MKSKKKIVLSFLTFSSLVISAIFFTGYWTNSVKTVVAQQNHTEKIESLMKTNKTVEAFLKYYPSVSDFEKKNSPTLNDDNTMVYEAGGDSYITGSPMITDDGKLHGDNVGATVGQIKAALRLRAANQTK